MKTFFAMCLLLLSSVGFANMASPIDEGTLGKAPFISEHVAITAENITIIPYGDFQYARFVVEYHLYADESYKEIPLLFYAADYQNDFVISIDGKTVTLDSLPLSLHSILHKNYAFFADKFAYEGMQARLINDASSAQLTAIEPDLKYFNIPIAAGKHIIRVAYIARRWEDHSPSISEFSFRYALSPAHQWKSYGTLNVTLDVTNLDKRYQNIYTNLSAPHQGDLQTVAHWQFNTLPVDVMMIQCQEYQPFWIRLLVSLNPWIFMLLVTLVGLYWHAAKIHTNRQYNLKKGISRTALVGSLLIPLLVLICSMIYHIFVSKLVGHGAGYFFLILFLYIFFMPSYLFVIWLYDWRLQIESSKKNAAASAE